MSRLRCQILTAERSVFEGMVDMVVAPGTEGQLGILPSHAPIITALTYGELIIHREQQEDEFIAIGGGFMEAGPEHVTILADSAERADEIDVARAEEARRRAQDIMSHERPEGMDLARAEAALRYSTIRIKVAHRRRRREGPGPGQRPGVGPGRESGD
jgi:F-type H+-transporting ATPase subunit epsilon